MEREDILEEWFFESLKTYRDLYVYQLGCPSRVTEWTSGKTLCVAGFSPSQNEILELQLPRKLLAGDDQGLCAERDFRVLHGGSTDGPVCCLRHVPGTRCVVTNDGLSSDLQVWNLGADDGDVIRRTGGVAGGGGPAAAGGSRMAVGVSSRPQVLHGARSGDVRLTELSSGRTLFRLESDSADRLGSLQFVSDSVFIAGCWNGAVYLADTRTPAAPQLTPPPESSGESLRWWTDASVGPPGCRIVRLSSSGQTVISDLRNPGGAVSRARLAVQSGRCRLDEVRVSWAPALGGRVSVSGFSGAVQIYDTSVWGAEPREVQPLFQHRGHAVSQSQLGDGVPVPVPVSITGHTWHPERPRTLLSAASDGSVHLWDWVDQSAGSE
ncbi:WD repeat-containing protein 73 [Brachionichthys hirsutus]|uniref:WD repeat-containing protein 73 n=1 Tax=Brachionichthys hirsutus TaxID=412623 RepID=UPI003604B2EF